MAGCNFGYTYEQITTCLIKCVRCKNFECLFKVIYGVGGGCLPSNTVTNFKKNLDSKVRGFCVQDRSHWNEINTS